MSVSRGALPAPLKLYRFVGSGTLTGFYHRADGSTIKENPVNLAVTGAFQALPNIPENAVGVSLKASSTNSVAYCVTDLDGTPPFDAAGCLAWGDNVPTVPTSFGRVA